MSNEPLGIFDSEFSTGVAPKQDDEPVQPQPASQPALAKFVRKIDLGDGSGVQVFEADTQDELIEKLVQAQTNATKKIRQQNRALKTRILAVPDKKSEPFQLRPVDLTDEQIFSIQRDLEANPRKAFRTIAEAALGCSIDDVRKSVEIAHSMQESAREAQAAQDFVNAHTDDFLPCPENYSRIRTLLDSQGYAMTRNSLEWAFQQLSDAGQLIEPEPQVPPTNPTPNNPPAPPARIEQQPTPNTVMTGIPDSMSRGSAPIPPQNQPMSDQRLAKEIANLPVDQARERIAQLMYEARQRQGAR